MGLDMYLHKKKFYMWGSEVTVKYKNEPKKDAQEHVETTIPTTDDASIIVEVEAGYWRKANQIHKWFVDNVQEGVDDCHEYIVTKPQFLELLDICKKSLEKKSTAKKLLPTQSGFFFGSTEYDKDYKYDLERTIEIIEKILEGWTSDEKYWDDAGWKYYYHSSW